MLPLNYLSLKKFVRSEKPATRSARLRVLLLLQFILKSKVQLRILMHKVIFRESVCPFHGASYYFTTLTTPKQAKYLPSGNLATRMQGLVWGNLKRDRKHERGISLLSMSTFESTPVIFSAQVNIGVTRVHEMSTFTFS